jgi:hypothetical protein
VALLALSLAVLAIGPAQPKLRAEPKPPAFWPPPALSRERALAATVRVDSRGGGAFATGTGVGVGAHVVLTNAHLTEDPVTLVTRCGDDEVAVEHVDRATDGTDVAVLITSGPNLLPVELAASDPAAGDRVLLAGYPNGVLTLTEGTVEGKLVHDGEPTIRFSPEPAIGQSGSPLLDADGRIAGLVFARDEVGGQGLAIPASRLRVLLDQFRSENVPVAAADVGDPAAVPARSSPCG